MSSSRGGRACRWPLPLRHSCARAGTTTPSRHSGAPRPPVAAAVPATSRLLGVQEPDLLLGYLLACLSCPPRWAGPRCLAAPLSSHSFLLQFTKKRKSQQIFYKNPSQANKWCDNNVETRDVDAALKPLHGPQRRTQIVKSVSNVAWGESQTNAIRPNSQPFMAHCTPDCAPCTTNTQVQMWQEKHSGTMCALIADS